ncbi:ATP-dependent protease ATPase subunit HslU [Geotoga petraea]|jgi:ATP-dependent HslUV protease ATP-binding subunit HslU|uniref:ATP-dependent protease ATPase subunit HslU n=1 Tax=Geotoga petraea TaxID=28234 RepID=A0A1G6JZ30_9BACT|nr:ATP-dependent protease ATPase subunit HslU [Geotoga petraea]MDK2945580.1 ATP-dependent HslUV protease ATP-binding subunit HslU [Geotoga sp.]SDC23841.1 ATP-dependent HslUV protease ATP-binding subunit HslU [Geotoga petraea]
MKLDDLTPKMIVKELDKYIIGQDDAKKKVAIALRNRIRRLKLKDELKKDVIPKNILMIGPTGVGKTEIARRLAEIASAPFVKFEATRFTEVGYVGKNVETMVKELVDVSINLVKKEMMEDVKDQAEVMVEERILDALVPSKKKNQNKQPLMNMLSMFGQNNQYVDNDYEKNNEEENEQNKNRKAELREKLKNKELEDVEVEIEVEEDQKPMFGGMGQEFEDMGLQLGEMFSNMMPKKTIKRKMKISDARKVLLPIEAEKLVDQDKMQQEGMERAQNRGIIFLDEIDKITDNNEKSSGAGVSREGVQRDLLPIVEGTNIMTKYGPVKTDYILFIAAGAFHTSKPSDLIPELQGRFPVRVELNDLTEEDFKSILTKPQNAIIKQYIELLKTDGVTIEFSEDGINSLAHIAFELNEKIENIGARRLYTVVERVLEEVSYEAPSSTEYSLNIDSKYVKNRLDDVVGDENLREYVL